MGQLLGVDKIVAGSIGKLGSTFIVSVCLIELRTGQIEKMVSEECDCEVERLLPVMKKIAKDLLSVTSVSTPKNAETNSTSWADQMSTVAKKLYLGVTSNQGTISNILSQSSSTVIARSSSSRKEE